MALAERWVRVGLCGVSLLLGCFDRGSAQSAGAPQVGVSAELGKLAAQAQTIFVGQIVAIERKGSVVDVTFRVELPVAGATGSTCTMREWAGLWPPGGNRYLVGQRVLAFLHGASASGMSSPVHGAEGLVPVVVQGLDAPKLLDIRRLAASVVRAPGTPLPTEADGAVNLADVLAVIAPAGRAGVFEPIRMMLPGRGRPPVDMMRQPSQGRFAPLLTGRAQGSGTVPSAAGAR